jgi:hypothetical protein
LIIKESFHQDNLAIISMHAPAELKGVIKNSTIKVGKKGEDIQQHQGSYLGCPGPGFHPTQQNNTNQSQELETFEFHFQ